MHADQQSLNESMHQLLASMKKSQEQEREYLEEVKKMHKEKMKMMLSMLQMF